MDFLLALVLMSSLYLQAAAEFDGRWPRQIASSLGLCRYGGRIGCCWGWTLQSWGQCQPFYVLRQRIARIRCQLKAVCQPRCKHGECIGPNKCKCHPGYAGKTCNQGALSCSMANCQYGCDVVKGQIRCQCPSPGLQLAPDGRTCVDVDECATGRAFCPRFRQCVNTFGSYICKCHKGFDLMYIGGKYQCHDIDECSLGQYQCSSFARCYNIHGSYKCKCKEGYQGDGLTCVYIPKVMIEPSGPIHVPKGNGTILKGDGGHSNWIPDVGSTWWPPKTLYIPPTTTNRPTSKPTTRPTPKPTPRPTPPPPPPPLPTELRTPLPPTTPEGPTTRLTTIAPAASTPPGGITVDNRIQTEPQKPRGDVFIPRQPSNDLFEIFEIERGVSADDEAKDDPGILVHSCNFDHGLCGWIREKDNDLHWEPIRDPAGGQYLTVSTAKAPGGKAARLVLPLGRLMHSGDLCLSFRHKVTGLHSGTLQVFVRKHGAHGAALWGRNGGHGWRQTQITLRGADVKSVIFKGEKRRGHTGEIGLDDVSLKKGHCSEEP
ncbi:nephronectin isoform X5 [Callithrix jacchus]|uniref:nephronectin isoform X3 n=1 Tax=Callithrix jacchus TaxID=9483 RepID=UPI0004F07905|nr:nephronectin isoform X3 [Callithrix jacchus]